MSLSDRLAAAREHASASIDPAVHRYKLALEAVQHAEEHPAPVIDAALTADLPPWSAVS